jgi:hypothetical protein
MICLTGYINIRRVLTNETNSASFLIHGRLTLDGAQAAAQADPDPLTDAASAKLFSLA